MAVAVTVGVAVGVGVDVVVGIGVLVKVGVAVGSSVWVGEGSSARGMEAGSGPQAAINTMHRQTKAMLQKRSITALHLPLAGSGPEIWFRCDRDFGTYFHSTHYSTIDWQRQGADG